MEIPEQKYVFIPVHVKIFILLLALDVLDRGLQKTNSLLKITALDIWTPF